LRLNKRRLRNQDPFKARAGEGHFGPDTPARARPAQISHVRGFQFDQDALTVLPASLVPPSMSDPATARQPAGQTWLAADPHAHIISVEPHRLEAESNGFRLVVEILAWADLDQDSTEDVLLMLSNYIIGGTLRFYHHAGITRLSEAGGLLPIELPEG